jgi:hypothetical protein
MTVSDLLEKPCDKSDNAIKLVTSCQQLVANLLQQETSSAKGTSSAKTTCCQLVNRFVTTCLQTCNNLLRFYVCTTHAKISHLVTSLPTSCQQDIFAQLVTSCQQVWTTCWQLVTTLSKLSDLCKVVLKSPLHAWFNKIVTTLCWQPCHILVISWL